MHPCCRRLHHRTAIPSRRHLLAAVLASLLLVAGVSPAAEIVPFQSTNQSPLIQIFGLPGTGHGTPLPRGQAEAAATVAVASHHVVEDNSREQLTLDGETTRLTIAARYGLLPRLEVGFRLPYVHHSGGFLDGFIGGYHDLFGFPTGGRDLAPSDRIRYRYRVDGVERIRIDTSGSGIGDLQLTCAWTPFEQGGKGFTLNAALKLPTGDSDRLQGSGSTDVALWLHRHAEAAFPSGNWAVYGSAGLLWMTKGKVLPEQQKSWVGFGSLGIGWAPLRRISLKLQADAHTAFFDRSDLKGVGSNAVQLVIGGTLALSERVALDIGVSEDLVVNTSPDVVFSFNLRTRF